jgi:iron complex outermembrane receptor protein
MLLASEFVRRVLAASRLCTVAGGSAALVALGAAAMPAPALAQDRADVAIEEIVVTARRREESLQDVPIAVTAFSAEQLEQTGAIDITALQQSRSRVAATRR